MTHAYWREGGPEFHNVNVMGVAHGLDKDVVLAHKKAIDEHLAQAGIPVAYTNVFWAGAAKLNHRKSRRRHISTSAQKWVGIRRRCANHKSRHWRRHVR